MEERLQPGLGLLEGDARLEAAIDIHPSLAAVEHIGEAGPDFARHCHGNVDERGHSRLDPVEAGLRDPDDGQRVIVDADGLANDAWIAVEAGLPVIRN